MTLEEKIMTRSIPEPNSGCWLWTGAVNGVYGILIDDKIVYAHRTSFQIFVRTLDEGELACHKCDNTYCVNPNHLFAGTHYDNHHDAMDKGRWTHGETHGMAKLKEVQVVSIRELFSEGAKISTLASFYDISESQISRIVAGTAWAHAGGATIINRRNDIIMSTEKVKKLRALRGSSIPRNKIASDFGITLSTLYAVWTGRQWKNV